MRPQLDQHFSERDTYNLFKETWRLHPFFSCFLNLRTVYIDREREKFLRRMDSVRKIFSEKLEWKFTFPAVDKCVSEAQCVSVCTQK